MTPLNIHFGRMFLHQKEIICDCDHVGDGLHYPNGDKGSFSTFFKRTHYLLLLVLFGFSSSPVLRRSPGVLPGPPPLPFGGLKGKGPETKGDVERKGEGREITHGKRSGGQGCHRTPPECRRRQSAQTRSEGASGRERQRPRVKVPRSSLLD